MKSEKLLAGRMRGGMYSECTVQSVSVIVVEGYLLLRTTSSLYLQLIQFNAVIITDAHRRVIVNVAKKRWTGGQLLSLSSEGPGEDQRSSGTGKRRDPPRGLAGRGRSTPRKKKLRAKGTVGDREETHRVRRRHFQYRNVSQTYWIWRTRKKEASFPPLEEEEVVVVEGGGEVRMAGHYGGDGGLMVRKEVLEEAVIAGGLAATQVAYAGTSVMMGYVLSLGVNPLTLIVFSSLSTFFFLAPLAFCFERYDGSSLSSPSPSIFCLITSVLIPSSYLWEYYLEYVLAGICGPGSWAWSWWYSSLWSPLEGKLNWDILPRFCFLPLLFLVHISYVKNIVLSSLHADRMDLLSLWETIVSRKGKARVLPLWNKFLKNFC